jgi:hypothetical protein
VQVADSSLPDYRPAATQFRPAKQLGSQARIEFSKFQQALDLEITLQFTADGELEIGAPAAPTKTATGGERLASASVVGLPLNKRDFSQLLLLASGTETDTNGAANFTQ